MSILKVEGLKKIYKSKIGLVQYSALKNINFEVDEGEFLGIMGPSGSGKTTLLNILGTIDKCSSGNIILGDKNLSNLNKKEMSAYRRENIGFIFQDYNLLNTLTVKENIILPLVLNKESISKMDSLLKEITNDLMIADILHKYPYEISGGQQQRVATARAVISKPRIILADEPTGNLDSKSSKELLDMLTILNTNYKSTILMVSHDPYATSYCNRVIFIKDGELYNEIFRGLNRKDFYDKIINTLASIGGERQ
ncbi:MAG: ABC transporter ATP-binding protein [Eubacteriaceae bacterium]